MQQANTGIVPTQFPYTVAGVWLKQNVICQTTTQCAIAKDNSEGLVNVAAFDPPALISNACAEQALLCSLLFFEVCGEPGTRSPLAQARSVPSVPHCGCNYYSFIIIQFSMTSLVCSW